MTTTITSSIGTRAQQQRKKLRAATAVATGTIIITRT
jgi:hypothetical protein